MKNTASKYRLENDGAFCIEGYNLTRPWASFFPGIAGLFGIPLWVFYVNRGQCISSFGIRSKDEAIMEFLPANKAYQLTPSQGFRTFIKVKDRTKALFYEPFSPSAGAREPGLKNKMVVRPFDLEISEENRKLGLGVSVSYFTVANAPFPALAREMTITNMSRKTKNLEFLDGVSVLVPYGVNNWFLKEMGRTIEAWMTVENLASGVPVYKLTTDPRDTAQVTFVKGAHFYLGFAQGKTAQSTKIIVDPQAVFGNVSDLSLPLVFMKDKKFRFPKHQVAKNKMPCAFSYATAQLKPGAVMKFSSLIGHVFDVDDIKKYGISRVDENFMRDKRQENQELITAITDRIFTASNNEAFDLYAQQTYLDNVMRGGLPYSVALNGHKKSVYVFSRKHGDLERDYNRFLVAPTYFSEGEGNYRDVNQNRRSDVFFNPLVGEKNVVDFMNLIQLDGYNPLVFKGERFVIGQETFLKSRAAEALGERDANKLAHILAKPFSLGEILRYIEENRIALSCPRDEFVKFLLSKASSTQEAVFGEGYWTDHWTYNTDLLESFRAVWPDRVKDLLFEKRDFTYFDAHAFVRPRSERYSIQHGEARQYHSIFVDDEKNALIQKRRDAKNKVRKAHGDGEVLETTLIDKYLCLVVNKLSTLDPSGAGIEMEADKPNWYDALNGLPGLFGSSLSETFELKRLILLLKSLFSEVPEKKEIAVLTEVAGFFDSLETLLKTDTSDLDFWDRSNTLKEDYRLKVRRGVSGEFRDIPVLRILEFFELALKKLDQGIAKGYDAKTGFYATYFSHKMTRYDNLPDGKGGHVVAAKEFKREGLPLFLEGFVHALRTESQRAKDIYQAVKKSPLWDKPLKMYKVNASLADESFEIGRAKAFTPGWLENESIWLHMEYKYLLELLKNGLNDEFYENFFQSLVPFQKPGVYGRSILENSSFIVSSAHPDASLHGAGFVARLSGSTAEFLHMWLLMNIGPQPFFLDRNGELALRFNPILCGTLFAKGASLRSYVDIAQERVERFFDTGTYGFLFLGRTLVVYNNPKKKDTFGKKGVRPVSISLYGKEGLMAEVAGDTVKAPYAERVRNGEVNCIEVFLS